MSRRCDAGQIRGKGFLFMAVARECALDLLEECYSSRELWEVILTAIKQVILVSDLEGRIILASPTARQMLGFDPEELVGQTLCRLFISEDLVCLYPNILYLARKNQTFEGEVPVVHRDGTHSTCYMVVQPRLAAQPEDSRLVMCIQDIEEQRRLERAQARDHYQDLVKIAGGIAHEIRNPLVGVGGFLNRLFRSCEQAEELQRYYDLAVDNLRRIESLIRKVEYFVRLPRPYVQEVHVGQAVGEVLDSYLDEMTERSIDVHMDIEEFTLSVDKDLFARSLSILIENAMDSLNGGGRIEIRANAEGERRIIRVTDNGRGIAAEDLPYIFNPFFSTRPGRVGIDLALVKRIAETHGGCAGVHSEHGRGSVFFMNFPSHWGDPMRRVRLENDRAEASPRPHGN